MNYLAVLYKVICASFVGMMSHVRKSYQVKNGTGFFSVIMFSLLVSVVASVLGFCLGAKLKFEALTFTFALAYAVISTVTASLCILGTAVGNISVLMMSATVGSLILPSLFGLITAPEENKLSAIKVVGFILAIVCIVLNFVNKNPEKKGKTNLKFSLLCLTVFFTNGSALIIYSLENKFCKDYPYFSFITEIMVLSAVVLIIIAIVYLLINKADAKTQCMNVFSFKSIIFVIVYAILFFAAELLAVKCAGLLPIVVNAPISFAVPLLVTGLIDFIVYRVVPSKKNLLQMAIAMLCALCFIL